MLQKNISSQISKFSWVGLGIILIAYAPGVFKESLWSDDYPIIMDTPAVAEHAFRDARPTAAAFMSLSFSLLSNATYGWILRSLGLLALSLLFLSVSERLKSLRNAGPAIFSISIAFCLPSFQMYIHWATCWLFLWAALASVWSFHLWTSKLISLRIFAVTLLVFAITIYPPMAMFYFSVIAVINIFTQSKVAKCISDLIQGLTLLVTSGIVSIVTVFLTMQFASVSPNERVALLAFSEIPKKIMWLITRPLVVGLRPFMIDSPNATVAIITALPAIFILLLGIRRQAAILGESTFSRIFWTALPILITIAPLAITSDNQIEFRVLPGYCWGICALVVYFFLEGVKYGIDFLISNFKLRRLVLFVAPISLSLLSIVSINLHYKDLIGLPYQKKNAFFDKEITACVDSRQVNRFVILAPSSQFPAFQRLGVFSMSTDLASVWVPKPNLELLLIQRSIQAPVVYLENRPIIDLPLNTDCVIDLEKFRKLLT